MSKTLVEIVKHIQTARGQVERQGVTDLVSTSGDGYNVLYLEWSIAQNVNVNEGWIKPLNLNPNVGQLVTFYSRGSDVVDRIWEKMLAGMYFVIVDRSTKWTKYQLFEFNAYTGSVKVDRIDGYGGTPAYRYQTFTATCRAKQGSTLVFSEQVYVKIPDLTGRTPSLGYTMQTPDTFAATAQVDGHRLTIDVDDVSLLQPGFSHWQVDQADDGSGTNTQTLVYGVNNLPALLTVTPGVTKYYRARAVSITGDFSAWTSYTSAVYDVVPAAPTWVSHTYRPDGHFVTWSHPEPASVNYFTLYRNTSASLTGATVVGTVPRSSTSSLIPYAAGGNYFGIKAVGYAGTDAGTVWFGPYNTATSTPVHTVNKTVANWLITWALIANAASYEVQAATSSGGAGAKLVATIPQPANVTTVAAQVTQEPGYTYFRVRSLGYDASVSSWSTWKTDTTGPAVPVISKITEDNNAVTIFMSPADTSHTSAGFSHYLVQTATSSGGAGATTIDSRAPYAPTLSYPLTTTGLLKYYRLIPVDIAGNQGTATAWTVSSYNNAGASVQDYFDTYGGDQPVTVDGLKWLLVEPADTMEWSYNPALDPIIALDSAHAISGQYALKFEVDPDVGYNTARILPSGWDLDQDGRFTDNDYFVFTIYIEDYTEIETLRIGFEGDGWAGYALITPSVNGYIFYKIKRSDFDTEGTVDWSHVTAIRMAVSRALGATGGTFIHLDDVRLVKADPADATTYNDTGGVWKFATTSGSTHWHIYPGNRAGEPPKPFALGNINEESKWQLAYVAESDIYTGTVQCGMFRKTSGYTAMHFFWNASTWSGYHVDFSGSALRLVKFTNSSETVLASASFLSGTTVNVPFWLGVDLREFQSDPGRIKVYASTTEGKVIHADNLKISYKDTSPRPAGGKVGVATYSSNARFFDFTAGSPAHAETADIAKAVDGPMIDGQDGNKRVFLSIIQKNSTPVLQISQDRVNWGDAVVPPEAAVITRRMGTAWTSGVNTWQSIQNLNTTAFNTTGAADSAIFTSNISRAYAWDTGVYVSTISGYFNRFDANTGAIFWRALIDGTEWLRHQNEQVSWYNQYGGWAVTFGPFYMTAGQYLEWQAYCAGRAFTFQTNYMTNMTIARL